ncbi:MAG: radical SAM protein [Sedimentisphaerales bacterium]|nr:radical SAM protein [Sedimentisphaerales bacterium]
MSDESVKKIEHVFGPIPSRRLGRSLGIDLVPAKTCTYDCLYCQVGRTTEKTTQRQQWVDIDKIIAELKTKLSAKPDYITFSGSGEPTLFKDCGELISRIRQVVDIPIAVITNGSLLSDPEVRKELLAADLVIPSLDAGDEETFQKINRPVTEITFDKMLEGLIDFRREYKGKYWLEVLLLEGLNDSDEQIDKIAGCIEKINPDKVQLNTVTRPPAEDVKAIGTERLNEIAARIYKNTEVIADFRSIDKPSDIKIKGEDIIETLKRRPCTAEEMAIGLRISKIELLKHVEYLMREGKVEFVRQGERIYYRVV